MFLFLESFQPQPCKHITLIPRWNDVETVVSTSLQREIPWRASRERSYFDLISHEAFLPGNDRNYSWH